MMDHDADRRLGRRVARLKGHWRWILVGTGLCTLASLGVSLLLPKVYRATTNLLVSESKIGPGTELPAWQYATLPTYEPFVDNDELIQRAIERFHLDQTPYDLDVDSFRRRDILDVRALKSTRLLEINVEFPDSRLAAGLANFFAQGAAEINSNLNVTGTSDSRSLLAKQLKEAQSKLAEADLQRTEVRARTRIEDKEKLLSILLMEKDQLSAQSQTLRLRLAQDDSKAKYLRHTLNQEPDTYRLTKSILSDRYAEKVAEKGGQGANPWPSISEETLNTTKEKVRYNFVDIMADVAAENAGLNRADDELGKVNAAISPLLVSLAQLHSQLDKADNDYNLAKEVVEVANRNYQEALVNASSKSQDIEQLAPAAVPAQPVRPRPFLNTFLGTLMGFVLLTTATSARESFRELHNATRDEEDERVGVSG
jgi:protein tyrosine kinase modulator